MCGPPVGRGERVPADGAPTEGVHDEVPSEESTKVGGYFRRSALIQPVTGGTLNSASVIEAISTGHNNDQQGSIDPLCARIQRCTIVIMIGRTGTDESYERRARFATFGVAFAAALIAIAMNRIQTREISKTGKVGSGPVPSVVQPADVTVSGDGTVSFG